MNYYALSALVNALTSLSLGVFVASRKQVENQVKWGFFLFTFFVFVWSFGYFFWQLSTNASDALFWSRVLMAGSIFIPISYFYFSLALVGLVQKRKRILMFGYVLFPLFFLLNFTPLFVHHVEPILSFDYWPMPGPLYHVFLAVWFFYVVYAIRILYSSYQKSTGRKNLQIKWVLLGTTIGYVAGSTNYFLWYKIPIPPILNILVSVYVICLAYAILRYRLMDIRVFIRKSLFYSMLLAIVMGLVTFIVFLLGKVFQDVFNLDFLVSAGILAMLVAIAFYPIKHFVQRSLDILFSQRPKLPASKEIIQEFLAYIVQHKEFQSILSEAAEDFQKEFGMKNTFFLLTDFQNRNFSTVFSTIPQKKFKLSEDHLLVQWLKRNEQLVHVEKGIKGSHRTSRELHEIKQYLDSKYLQAAIPMSLSDRLYGIFLLGERPSRKPFTEEEIQKLKVIQNRLICSLMNVILAEQTLFVVRKRMCS